MSSFIHSIGGRLSGERGAGGSHATLRPWKRARVTLHGAERKAAVEVLPERVAVRWGTGKRDRLQDALLNLPRPQAKLLTREAERLFLLDVTGASAGPALWRYLAELQEQGLLDWASPLLRDVESGLSLIATDEIVVRLRDGPGARHSLRQMVAPLGLRVVQRNEFVANQFVVRMKRFLGLGVLERAEALAALPGVSFAAPNFLTEAAK